MPRFEILKNAAVIGAIECAVLEGDLSEYRLWADAERMVAIGTFVPAEGVQMRTVSGPEPQ